MACAPTTPLANLTAINGQDNIFDINLTADSGLTGKGLIVVIKRSVLDADNAATTIVLGTTPRTGIAVSTQTDTAIAATMTLSAANTATLGLSDNVAHAVYSYSISLVEGSVLYPVGDGALTLQRVAVGSGALS